MFNKAGKALSRGVFVKDDVTISHNMLRHHRIEGREVTINGNQDSVAIPFTNTHEFPFVYVVISSIAETADHDFICSIQMRIEQAPGGQSFFIVHNEDRVITVNNFNRGASDFIEVRGDQVNVRIHNQSDTEKTYNVLLYGVR